MLTALYRLRFNYRRRKGIPFYINKLNTGLVNVLARGWYALSAPRPRRDAKVKPVIISLTTYGERVKLVAPCVNSLLRQRYGNFRVILWLSQAEYQQIGQLPKALRTLAGQGLEVYFVEDLRSYKKVYFAAQRYPDTMIVTADDDFLYPENWLSELAAAHERMPEAVICHRAHEMTPDPAGRLAGYEQWNWYANGIAGPSHALHILSGAGALFPAGFFDAQFFDWEGIAACCPTTDDIWLKYTALRRGYRVAKVRPYSKSLVCVRGTQEKTLYHENRKNRNDEAIAAIDARYQFDFSAALRDGQ